VKHFYISQTKYETSADFTTYFMFPTGYKKLKMQWQFGSVYLLLQILANSELSLLNTLIVYLKSWMYLNTTEINYKQNIQVTDKIASEYNRQSNIIHTLKDIYIYIYIYIYIFFFFFLYNWLYTH